MSEVPLYDSQSLGAILRGSLRYTPLKSLRSDSLSLTHALSHTHSLTHSHAHAHAHYPFLARLRHTPLKSLCARPWSLSPCLLLFYRDTSCSNPESSTSGPEPKPQINGTAHGGHTGVQPHKPFAFSPEPETQKVKTGTRDPEPENWNPKPETRTPNPETRKPRPRIARSGTRGPKLQKTNPESRKPETRNPKPEPQGEGGESGSVSSNPGEGGEKRTPPR